MKWKNARWLLLVSVAIVAAGCSSAISESTVPPVPTATPLPTAVSGRAVEPAPVDAYREDSFDQVAATGKPQLVEFFAYWCTTCRAMRPIVSGLEAEYWGKIDFVYLDIDNPSNTQIKQQFGFVAQPLFVLIQPDGTEVARWFGFVDKSDFQAAFDSYLASASQQSSVSG